MLDWDGGVIKGGRVEQAGQRAQQDDDGENPEEKSVDHDPDIAPVVLLTLDEILLITSTGYLLVEDFLF